VHCIFSLHQNINDDSRFCLQESCQNHSIQRIFLDAMVACYAQMIRYLQVFAPYIGYIQVIECGDMSRVTRPPSVCWCSIIL